MVATEAAIRAIVLAGLEQRVDGFALRGSQICITHDLVQRVLDDALRARRLELSESDRERCVLR
jgi:hypothetical protein